MSNKCVDKENTTNPEVAKKLAKLACINSNLEKLNEAESLSSEFDEISTKRITALKDVQDAFRGEAERLGLKDEQDVVDMIKEVRREKQGKVNVCNALDTNVFV
jgi:hypothetical protein